MKKRSKRGSRISRRHTRLNDKRPRGNGEGDNGYHHIAPQARGGPDEAWNLYRWSREHKKKHRAWHNLFADLLPSEVIILVRQWTRKDGKLDLRYFRSRRDRANKRLLSWTVLFGDGTPGEAIEWIEREFIRKEWFSSGTPGVNTGEEVDL